jgi:hypothetical protein
MSKEYDVMKETIERLAALNTHLINKGDAFDEKDAADVDAAIISFRSGHRPPYDLSVEADRIGETRYTELFYSKANHSGLNQDARETIGHMISCLSR